MKDRTKKRDGQTVNAEYEQLWLQYFNDTLFSRGLISEDTRNRMSAQIKARARAR